MKMKEDEKIVSIHFRLSHWMEKRSIIGINWIGRGERKILNVG
jgi:hypothetical protein